MIYVRLKSWIQRFFSWLSEAKEFIACVLVIVNAIVFTFYLCPSEASIRMSGYILQMLGMLFAVAGILSIRMHFGYPSLFKLILEWLKRFPSLSNSIVIQGVPAELKIKGGRARIELWKIDNSDAPLEERVSSIVSNLGKVRQELESYYFELNEIKDELEESSERQEESINQLEDKIGNDIELLHTKDLSTSLVGLVWITVGITFSTLPKELLNIVK